MESERLVEVRKVEYDYPLHLFLDNEVRKFSGMNVSGNRKLDFGKVQTQAIGLVPRYQLRIGYSIFMPIIRRLLNEWVSYTSAMRSLPRRTNRLKAFISSASPSSSSCYCIHIATAFSDT